MRLTQVLNGPPVFRYWKHFGAGLKRRQPNFKHWRHTWIAHVARLKIPDHTIPLEKLPPGSRILNAEDFLNDPISDMPSDIIRKKQENVVYDHPWPYNVQLDPINMQDLMYCYTINTRFFTPREDCQVLTNTIIQTDNLEAHPPIEPSGENVNYARRQHKWATQDDSVLVKLPMKREWPKMNINPPAVYGITKERAEHNVLNTLSAYAQTLLAKHYHDQKHADKLVEVLNRRSLQYPHCIVPFKRGDKRMHLDLFIESLSIDNKPLPVINDMPEQTRHQQPVDYKPRTWRSTIEQSRDYSPNWSFTLPHDAHLHTVYLASRIKRDHRDHNEMPARAVVHAFGLASQFARLRSLSKMSELTRGSKYGSIILEDPLNVEQINESDLLDSPIVLQTISYDKALDSFYFMRYQLNTLKFDDNNEARVKNQAWLSGPISDLEQVLRYYLDFEAFDPSAVKRMRSESELVNVDDTANSGKQSGETKIKANSN